MKCNIRWVPYTFSLNSLFPFPQGLVAHRNGHYLEILKNGEVIGRGEFAPFRKQTPPKIPSHINLDFSNINFKLPFFQMCSQDLSPSLSWALESALLQVIWREDPKLKPKHIIAVQALVGDISSQSISEYKHKGYQRLKIKIGRKNAHHENKLINQLHKEYPVPIRIDVNNINIDTNHYDFDQWNIEYIEDGPSNLKFPRASDHLEISHQWKICRPPQIGISRFLNNIPECSWVFSHQLDTLMHPYSFLIEHTQNKIVHGLDSLSHFKDSKGLYRGRVSNGYWQ